MEAKIFVSDEQKCRFYSNITVGIWDRRKTDENNIATIDKTFFSGLKAIKEAKIAESVEVPK